MGRLNIRLVTHDNGNRNVHKICKDSSTVKLNVMRKLKILETIRT